jgi:spore maturation protein CgeB/ubiquinone/menaquinone biosynthesis C-methylase UbiE
MERVGVLDPMAVTQGQGARVYLGEFGSRPSIAHIRSRIHWLGRQVSGQRVLDIGCGAGVLSILLGREGFLVTGIDTDAESIRSANRLLDKENEAVRQRVRFTHANVAALDAPATAYDSLLIGAGFEHVLEPRTFMENCLRQLAPGGTCILTTPFGRAEADEPKQVFVLSDLVELLSGLMTLSHVSIAEGSIRVVGRKPGAGETVLPVRVSDHLAVTPLVREVERAALELQDRLARLWQDCRELQRRVKHSDTQAQSLEALAQQNATLAQQLVVNQQQIEELRQRCAREYEEERAREKNRARLEAELERLAERIASLNAEKIALARRAQAARGAAQQAHAPSREAAAISMLRPGERGDWGAAGVVVSGGGAEWWGALHRTLLDEAAAGHEGVALLHPTDKRVKLGRRPRWVTAELRNATACTLRGVLFAGARQRAQTALARIVFLDAQRKVLAPPYVGVTTSPEVGPYVYLNSREATGAFEVHFRTPREAAFVCLGLQSYRARGRRVEMDAALHIAHNGGRLRGGGELVLHTATDESGAARMRGGNSGRVLPLRRESIYATAVLEGGGAFELLGCALVAPDEQAKAALVHFRFSDQDGQVISPPLAGFAHSDDPEIGAFRYLEPDGNGRFTVTFTAPPAARAVQIGFRAWRNQAPVLLYDQMLLAPQGSAGAVARRRASTPLRRRVSSLDGAPVVAAVLDAMSTATFGPDCRLLRFTPDNWRDALEQQPADMLLVESAWNGNDGSWQYLIGEYPKHRQDRLRELVAWCRQRQIPTVFWNKEDPVHFARFEKAAALFDFVFTTDANVVSAYRDVPDSAIRVVKPLMFAAQPRLHNPVGCGPRVAAPCFAGSYYGSRHPGRRQQMDILLEAAAPFGLVIYDRNHNSDTPDFAFPERFRPHIKGSLSYERVVEVYKQHKVCLNVNSVDQSPTMFARRVFELLACGAAVVSTPSTGMSRLFGEVVQSGETPEEYRHLLQRLLEDDDYRRALVRRGLRIVMTQHTVRHRLRLVAETVGLDAFDVSPPQFGVVATVRTADEAGRLGELLARQTRRPTAVWVGIDAALEPALARERLAQNLPAGTALECLALDGSEKMLAGLPERVSQSSVAWVALLDPANEYDQWFLEDLVTCPLFTSAEVIGKAAWGYRDAEGRLCWKKGPEHQYALSVHPQACLVAARIVGEGGWSARAAVAQERIAALRRQGTSVYGNDRDGFIAAPQNVI